MIRFRKLTQILRAEDGATAVEYGLILAVIVVAILVAVTAVGGSINDIFMLLANHMTLT